MFGRLLNAFARGAEASRAAPASRTRVRPEDVIEVSDSGLRALLRNAYDPVEGSQPELAPILERAELRSLAVELVRRAPLALLLSQQERSDPARQLARRLETIIEEVRRALYPAGGEEPSYNEGQLLALLAAVELLALQNHSSSTWGLGQWLRPVVRAAARHRGNAVRKRLVLLIDTLATEMQPDTGYDLAKELLAETDVSADQVSAVRTVQAELRRRDAVREKVVGSVPHPLRPALTAVLDGQGMMNSIKPGVGGTHPALQPLKSLSKPELGLLLDAMLDLLERRASFGIDGWSQIVRRSDGRYGLDEPHDRVHSLGNIVSYLLLQKPETGDLDRTASQFLTRAAATPSIFEPDKRIVTWLLGVAAGHPSGATVAELRRQLRAPSHQRWINDRHLHFVEESLRELPDQPSASPAKSTQAPVATAAFGRKGAIQASAPAPSLGLELIALPDFPLERWDCQAEIGRHFDNLLDDRLFDEPHRSFLERMAAVAREAEGLIGSTDLVEVRGQVVRILTTHGFGRGAEWSDRTGQVYRTIVWCAHLHGRAQAFAPLVRSWPLQMRALSKLSNGIEGKATPPVKWLAEAHSALESFSDEERLKLLDAVVAAPLSSFSWHGGLTDKHLRTLLYALSNMPADMLGPRLTAYALKQCYASEPGSGIRAEKLGNACLWILSNLPDGAGVPYLARILSRVRYPKIRAKVDERLNAAAEAAGISRSALDELTVPTHELEPDGTRTIVLDGGSATLSISGARSVALAWTADNGKTLKTPSTAMKADRAALKAVKDTAKEIEADLGTQVIRLQQLYLADRRWPAEEWRARYLDHPLVGTLAAKLIWWVEKADGGRTAALPTTDGFVDRCGASVPWEDRTVRLWHPIEDDVQEVVAWRDRLETLELTQPFAQAWREIYALTDAERTTATYSNRWAAHFLKQHQAMTLARLNGWKVTHRMWVDAPNDQPWHLPLDAHTMVADYWVEGAGGDDPAVTDTNAYVYVRTDRVQFHRMEQAEAGPVRGPALQLVDVPPVVLSEVMRHADLFTAIASIAADPEWLDRGADAAHPTQWGVQAAAYWKEVNGAELAEAAERRRELIERIIPRLAIADQLSLDDRHLLVAGKRHNYRIHLTSGACSRESQHICIVPAPASGGPGLWLPFEGDRTLSIILSKALLLAADDKITDPVILRQL